MGGKTPLFSNTKLTHQPETKYNCDENTEYLSQTDRMDKFRTMIFAYFFLKFSIAGLIESSTFAIEWVNNFLDVSVCWFDIDKLRVCLKLRLSDLKVCLTLKKSILKKK